MASYISSAGAPRWLIDQWKEQLFSLILSAQMLAKFEEKIYLDRITRKYHISVEGVETFKALLLTQAEWVSISPDEFAAVSGDPEDDYVLATALKAGVSFLVTRDDKHLLPLKEYQGIVMINPGAFRDILSQVSSQSN